MSNQQTIQVEGTPVDFDGDRETDAYLSGPFDANGNGVEDTVLADVDFDGQADAAILDLDEDGEIDSAAAPLDLDGDGTDESVVVDVGIDGTYEAIVSDVAGDGTPDLIIADSDLDGELDTAVVDSDNDGLFDEVLTEDLAGTTDEGWSGIGDDSIVAYGSDDSAAWFEPVDTFTAEDSNANPDDGGWNDSGTDTSYGC